MLQEVTQTLFIYGLFILGLACVAPIIDRCVMSTESTPPRRLILLTVLCTLATVYPAWRAAQMAPAEGLRHE